MNGSAIDKVNQIKDLGIILDPQLTFVPHIQYLCNHATKMMGFIYRNTVHFRNTEALLTLYYVYVRAKLEYGSMIWDPYYDVHIASLERIQRKFCKRLYYIKHGVYPVRSYPNDILLKEFNLCTLKARRTFGNIYFLFKLIHGIIVNTKLLNDIHFLVPRLNSRHHVTFSIDTCRTNQHYYAPLNNICRCYNVVASVLDIFQYNVTTFRRNCKKLILC